MKTVLAKHLRVLSGLMNEELQPRGKGDFRLFHSINGLCEIVIETGHNTFGVTRKTTTGIKTGKYFRKVKHFRVTLDMITLNA